MALSRVMLLAPPRDLTALQHAQYLLEAMALLSTVDDRLNEWRLDLGSRRGDVVSTADAVVAELARRTRAHDHGGKHSVRSELMLAVPEGRRIRAHLSLSVGHDEQAGRSVPCPATIKLSWLGRNAPSAADFHRMLTLLVDLYRPLWATVGGSYTPSPRVAPDGTPAVGWDTFLCRQYGPLPRLPDEVAVSAWGELGTIVRAFPEVLDETDMEHLAALCRLERALCAAGTLVQCDALGVFPPLAPLARAAPAAAAAPADHTMDVAHANLRASALPFREAADGARPPPAAIAEADAPAKGGTLDVAHLPDGALAAMAPRGTGTVDMSMPSHDARSDTASAWMSVQRITSYAELHVRLATGAEPRGTVLARHGIRDEAELAAIDAWWRDLLAREPMRNAQWRALYDKFSRELGRAPKP